MARRIFAWSALALLTAAGCEQRKTVTFDSKPEGATVWVGNQILGPAPQEIPIPENTSMRIRLALPGYQDWEKRFGDDDLNVDQTYRVELRPRKLQSVWFRSTPPDAEVRVNGELRGRTPLLLGDLPPGSLTVVFSAPGRESVSRNVELDPGDETRTISADLPGMTEEIYRRRIKDNPKDLNNYADLAHHLVLQHRFEQAAQIVGEGLRLYTKGGKTQGEKRMLQELQRIYDPQFDYGTNEDVKQARQALARELESVISDHPKANSNIYRQHIALLLKLGQRDDAKDLTRQAIVAHPNDRYLKNMCKKLGIELGKDKDKDKE
ncbi:MAG: PEGA domain-containing protein [Verrucomicrobiota bacterium]